MNDKDYFMSKFLKIDINTDYNAGWDLKKALSIDCGSMDCLICLWYIYTAFNFQGGCAKANYLSYEISYIFHD